MAPFLFLINAANLVDDLFFVSDPVMVVVCFWAISMGLVIATYGYRFDQINIQSYDYFLKLKNNTTSGTLDKKNTGWSGPYSWLILRVISWADHRQDPVEARSLVCLVLFLNTLIQLPILMAAVVGVALLGSWLSDNFGPLGLLGSIAVMIIIIYTFRFRQVNQYVVDLFMMLDNPDGVSDLKKGQVIKYSVKILLAIMVICLMTALSGMFIIVDDRDDNPIKNDFILGSWTAITDRSTSNITFYDDGNFTWSNPIFGTGNDYKGSWKNVGNNTNKMYTVNYYDPDVQSFIQKNLTFARSYYHAYGDIVINYPYFNFDNSNEMFSSFNSTVVESIPEIPTVMPPPHLPEPGKDVIVGAWKKDAMQQFDWFWVFDEDGTYRSINSGITDETGTWTNIGQYRYKVILSDGNGRYVGYSDGKIYNEHYKQGTFSWVGYASVLPF